MDDALKIAEPGTGMKRNANANWVPDRRRWRWDLEASEPHIGSRVFPVRLNVRYGSGEIGGLNDGSGSILLKSTVWTMLLKIPASYGHRRFQHTAGYEPPKRSCLRGALGLVAERSRCPRESPSARGEYIQRAKWSFSAKSSSKSYPTQSR